MGEIRTLTLKFNIPEPNPGDYCSYCNCPLWNDEFYCCHFGLDDEDIVQEEGREICSWYKERGNEQTRT